MNMKDKDFSKVSHIIIDSGILAELNGKEVKVYLVINRFAGYQDGISKPTVMTISRLSGVSKNHIKGIVDKLESMGLILTKRTGERFQFRKIYGVVKRDLIEPEVALSVIPRNKKNCMKIPRSAKGRFERIPKNTEGSIPVNVESRNPGNKEEYVPQNKETCIIPEKEEKKENRETTIRDIYVERKIPETSLGSGEKHPVSKIGLYAQEHGFDKAMRLQEGNPQSSSASEDFKKLEAEKIEEAKKWYGFSK
jgi:hypothetical protein